MEVKNFTFDHQKNELYFLKDVHLESFCHKYSELPFVIDLFGSSGNLTWYSEFGV